MRQMRILSPLLCAASLLLAPGVSQAGVNLLTTSVQAAGANWNNAIWKTNNGAGVGIGTAVAPVASNTYSMVYNGTAAGNGANNTRVRNPAATGLQTFPGDQLTMATNTELRAKTSGAILNFPGVGGNPGLVVSGGIMNAGDDGTMTYTGRIQIASQSFISHGANGTGGGLTGNARNLVFAGQVSGPGNLVIINCRTNTPQQFSNNGNTFSGQWFVQAGWLLGSGTNSLGTNSITVDPNYTGFLDAMPAASSPLGGPAVVEFNYDLNSAGVLTLTNGGMLRLHQNCVFSGVVIEGVALTPGTHFIGELLANFGNNISANSSGTITVQPYGPPPPLAPIITVQPQPQTLFPGGTARFAVSATSGAAAGVVTYHWQKAGVNLTDGGNISGSTTSNLTVTGVSAADAATYGVVVANAVGSTPSAGTLLAIATPDGGSYEPGVVAARPVAFYELNETGDPSTALLAYDYVGGYNGVYGAAVQNGNPGYGVSGPLPTDGFPGFPNPNGAARFAQFTPLSYVTLPKLNLNTNTVTITAWLNPNSPQSANNGIVFCRGGTTVAGLNYTGVQDPTGNYTLGYTWNNEPGSYNWNSGLSVPQNQWSLVALAIGPTNATIYVVNAAGLAATSHPYTHTNQAFDAVTLIGADALNTGAAAGNRGFSGTIDDVGIFNTTLGQDALVSLYTNATHGSAIFGPFIAVQPASLNLFVAQTARFSVVAGANPLPS